MLIKQKTGVGNVNRWQTAGNFLLAIFVAVIFLVVCLVFSKEVDQSSNLSFEEKASIGTINMIRTVVIFGVLTVTYTLLIFRLKRLWVSAALLIIFWVLGTGLVIAGLILSNNASDKELTSYNQIDHVANQNLTNATSTAPTIVLTATPLPITKATVLGAQTSQATSDPDPIVNCNYPHTGTIPVHKSECAGTKVDCEIVSGKWQVVWKKECEALRNSEKKIGVKTVKCELSYGTYQVSKEFCDEYKEKDKPYSPMIYPTYTPLPVFTLAPFKIDCYVGNQVIPQLTAEDCSKRLGQYSANLHDTTKLQEEIALSCRHAIDAWNVEKKRFLNDPENQKFYDGSADLYRALVPYMQDIQASMRARGCTETLYLN